MPYRIVSSGDNLEARKSWLGKEQIFRTGSLYLVLSIVGVLLGRATILHAVSPFALAYFVTLTEVAGRRKSWPALFALAGMYQESGLFVASGTASTFLLYRILRKVIFGKRTPDLHWLPFVAGFLDIAVHLVLVHSMWTRYNVMLSFADGALVVILALIFLQSIPSLMRRSTDRHLSIEQTMSITILVGSVIAGLSGLEIQGIPIVAVAMDWVVLVFAWSGGVGISASVAIVIGVLALLDHALSLSGVSILAFSGLLAGLVKDAGRLFIGLAFILCLSVITVGHSANWQSAQVMVMAGAVATALFLLMPHRLKQELAKYIPGTTEHRFSAQERNRRVQQLLSAKISEMSAVFEELSAAFMDTTETTLISAQQMVERTVGNAAQTVCQACPRRLKCWEKEGYATYQALMNTISKLETTTARNIQPSSDLKERCIRLDPMMAVLRRNIELTDRDAKWVEQLRTQRLLVGTQLTGVASVVRHVAGMLDDATASAITEEGEIVAALEQLGLYVENVHVVNLDPGKVEIEITQPSAGAYENSVRVIAPLLSGIVGENISVTHVRTEGGGPCTSVFASSRLFDVQTSAATVAKDGRVVSGDTYTSLDLGNGRHAVAVSDGMGNGERARQESKAAIGLLQKLLQVGFDEHTAIQTVNATLFIRSREEMFTTLDMALIDLYTAKAQFLKIGSSPSFIIRKDEVIPITGMNVPIGILREIEIQSVEEQLEEGDLLILISDGIYDVAYPDGDNWVRTQIERLGTRDPQEIADTLIEAAVRYNHGNIEDDMTVVVSAIISYRPEWAAIKLPGIRGLRGERKSTERGA